MNELGLERDGRSPRGLSLAQRNPALLTIYERKFYIFIDYIYKCKF